MSMGLDLSRCRIPPEGIDPYPNPHFAHQVVGIEHLVKWDDPSTGRIAGGCFALLDEMGAGKTKQEIDAACVLFMAGEIDRVIVVCPASVREVYYDRELGELNKHLWFGLGADIVEYHARVQSWKWAEKETGRRMQWIITNYELLRQDSYVNALLPYCNSKTLILFDEASSIKSWKAQQTEACVALRKRCRRMSPMTGTPIANGPMDMFALGNIMDKRILDCPYITHFKARYAVMGGYEAEIKNKKGIVIKTVPTQILKFVNLDDLQRRFAPYVIRRLTKDCIDLPPVLPPVTITATLTPKTWNHYKAMRDDMVVWLSNASVSQAAQAVVKTLRLAQITSGFLGGVENIQDMLGDDPPEWMTSELLSGVEDVGPPVEVVDGVVEIGREKLDAVQEFHERALAEDLNLKLLVWCRFIPELRRFLAETRSKHPTHEVGSVAGKGLMGETKKIERAHALRLLHPVTAPPGPVTVGGTYGTGSLGLNFTACHTVVNMSYDYSYWKFEQSSKRVQRPGQIHPVSIFDVEARGPKGQKTIDHVIIKARRNKENVALWTTAAWIAALTEE